MKVDAWAYMPVERICGAARVGSVVAVVLAVPVTAGAQSHCKGLSRENCDPARACQWMPERVAGETKTASGRLHKSSAKAHCRLDVRRAAEIAAQQK